MPTKDRSKLKVHSTESMSQTKTKTLHSDIQKLETENQMSIQAQRLMQGRKEKKGFSTVGSQNYNLQILNFFG